MNMNYRISIENYLSIDKLELDLAPGVLGFTGDNAQGKTNILKAIQALLDTKSDPSKIRDGAERFVIRMDVYDKLGELIADISRIQTKTNLRITSHGLPKGATPAAFLARLLDSKMLNPLKIIQDDPVSYLKQHLPSKIEEADVPRGINPEILKELPENGFDYARVAADRISADRTSLGRDIKRNEGGLADLKVGMPEQLGDPPHIRATVEKEIELAKGELAQISTKKQHFNSLKQQHDLGQREIDEQKSYIQNGEKQIVEMTAKIKEIHETNKKREDWIGDKLESIDKISQEMTAITIPDPANLDTQISAGQGKLRECDQHDQTAERFKVVRKKIEDLNRLRKEHEVYDGLYKHFAYSLPKTLIERCKLPVEGLEFKDAKLYVDGRGIDLLSASERAIVATRLAVAIAKKKGHIAISLDGVEIMDAKHREAFLNVAKESGLKVFYTRLGEPNGEHEFKVIDGQVQSK